MIRIGIVGYGNLGRGTEAAILQNPDMELKAVFTRRSPSAVSIRTKGVPVVRIEDIAKMKGEIDVAVLCGGSATDLPIQTPEMTRFVNTVDSFDTHAKIPEHFAAVDRVAKEAGTVSVISVGWDPGLFSVNRLYSSAVLPCGKDYTFWGKGVSQGHSDAIRRIEGVLDAKQYTIPSESAISSVRRGEMPELTIRQKHTRECFVVAHDGADKERIEREIKGMPNYFVDYDTVVHFITKEEFERDHAEMPHGGFVFRSGKTGFSEETDNLIEYSLKLGSNPEFTASVILTYARAAYRLSQKGDFGAKTVFDIAPALLSPKNPEDLRKEIL